MLVSIYNIGRNCTFERVKGSEVVRVKVPAGSELLHTNGLGLELFVPGAGDKLVRFAWPARLVWDEMTRPGGKFKAVNTRKRVTAR
jgi:hypothetical protein